MDADLFALEMDYRSKLLVKCGFIKKDKKQFYKYNEGKKEYMPIEGYKFSTGDADEEEIEMSYRNQYAKTGFPKTVKTYRLHWEVPDLSLEEPYFWFLEATRESYVIVEKLEDSFSASENSAFFGVTQQRLGAQQEKISQFLATIGKMIKELFQMVRELRIIDERLKYYEGVDKELGKPLAERSKSDEITLKGLFVDLVQQGAKSAASVFGMARELEFITLPDLFFDAPPFRTTEELDAHLKSLGKDFNQNVIRVLNRHLNQYVEWRKRTHQEHAQRKKFMLSYLQQHFDIIQMYINWLKPYLRHVARLTMKEQNTSSADIVSAFEGSMLDIELLFRKSEKTSFETGVHGVILLTYHYRTRPELKIVQEGYNRGPTHTGLMIAQMRTYLWSDKELNQYRELKKKETLELMGKISSSVQQAMESLGEELTYYLNEAKGQGAGRKDAEKGAESAGKKSLAEKFFGDFYIPSEKKVPSGSKSVKDEKKDLEEIEAKKSGLKKHVSASAWNTYKNFKKAHRMLAW